MKQLVWFRSDLRVADNPALLTACESGQPVAAVFIATPTQWLQHSVGDNKISFVAAHLEALQQQLNNINVPLHRLCCPSFTEVPQLLADFCQRQQVATVLCNDEPGVNEASRDEAVKQQLQHQQVGWQRFSEQNLLDYHAIFNGSGAPYRVFTPFMKRARVWLGQTDPQPLPPPIAVPQQLTEAENQWLAPPTYQQQWPIGEAAAQRQLQRFLTEAIHRYDVDRDFPAVDGTSAISPYLAAGVLSPLTVYQQLRQADAQQGSSNGSETWCNELIWREFYRYLLLHFPKLSKSQAMYPEKQIFWDNNPARLQQWQQGQTGYPMVDAGMRQLNQTGWMHNRLRMLCANFLVRDLHIDWRLGEAYFAKKLVDHDFASNNGGWQWAAGCGADAAPYFRHFSPLRQAERFDKEQAYQRHYLPELSDGSLSYPEPIVDHASQTKRFTAQIKERA
ncbi:cryptochrome/photolyase family protein [Ferrimonas senticii]|uniref:cryptochrome/photolyase family protein n=1 Tax=Ferrimonas senticii TaxID=394566 RepID=UPI00042481D7|nr:FAD-binding domain-containing protein [Ferrimonas senticii]